MQKETERSALPAKCLAHTFPMCFVHLYVARSGHHASIEDTNTPLRDFCKVNVPIKGQKRDQKPRFAHLARS